MKNKPMPKYAARRFAGKASLVKEVGPDWGDRHALLRATRPFRAWKKVRRPERRDHFKVIALTIPKGALFWCHAAEAKCRTDRAIPRGDGVAMRDEKFVYERDVLIEPSRRFTMGERVCASGIHFFATEAGARNYYWT